MKHVHLLQSPREGFREGYKDCMRPISDSTAELCANCGFLAMY
jgi:hypothetical protein